MSSRIIAYADESSIAEHRFMALGFVAVAKTDVALLEQEISEFRASTNMTRELKWGKISNQKVEEYRAFIDLFFRWNTSGRLQFHCLILDRHRINHRKFSGGDAELGFYKFFYQLLLYRFGRNFSAHELEVMLDYRLTGYSLDNLRNVLNAGMRKKRYSRGSPFVIVQHVDSKTADVLQMLDVILGGIAYRKNGHHLKPDAKQAKKTLSELILSKAGIGPSLANTPASATNFGIWNFNLK